MTGIVTDIVIKKLLVIPNETGFKESELDFEKQLKQAFSNLQLSNWPEAIFNKQYPASMSKTFVNEGKNFLLAYRGATKQKLGLSLTIIINKDPSDSYKPTKDFLWVSDLFNGEIKDTIVLGQQGKDLKYGGVIIGFKPAILLYLLSRENGLLAVVNEIPKHFFVKEFIDFVSQAIDGKQRISVNENNAKKFVKSCINEIEERNYKNILEEKFNLSQKGLFSSIKNLFK